MYYINALKLINLCVEHNILQEKDNKIFVYRSKGKNNKEGWHLESKETLALELKEDKKEQETLICELKKKGIDFKDKAIPEVFNES